MSNQLLSTQAKLNQDLLAIHSRLTEQHAEFVSDNDTEQAVYCVVLLNANAKMHGLLLDSLSSSEEEQANFILSLQAYIDAIIERMEADDE
ncbi:hypothetical protein VCHA53O466_140181 [Vibrio chagasii]|nr:hypothetical protein VCHA53O466_140181 [Vibrio chagasii]